LRVHVVLRSHPDVMMITGKTVTHMCEGEAFVFDNTGMHSVRE